MESKELDNRFKFHPATDSLVAMDHETVRELCGDTARAFNKMLPDSREKSLAITKLEEAMMWANAAIARHGRNANPNDVQVQAGVAEGVGTTRE